jgi:hypothetical protein
MGYPVVFPNAYPAAQSAAGAAVFGGRIADLEPSN